MVLIPLLLKPTDQYLCSPWIEEVLANAEALGQSDDRLVDTDHPVIAAEDRGIDRKVIVPESGDPNTRGIGSCASEIHAEPDLAASLWAGAVGAGLPAPRG